MPVKECVRQCPVSVLTGSGLRGLSLSLAGRKSNLEMDCAVRVWVWVWVSEHNRSVSVQPGLPWPGPWPAGRCAGSPRIARFPPSHCRTSPDCGGVVAADFAPRRRNIAPGSQGELLGLCSHAHFDVDRLVTSVQVQIGHAGTGVDQGESQR